MSGQQAPSDQMDRRRFLQMTGGLAAVGIAGAAAAGGVYAANLGSSSGDSSQTAAQDATPTTAAAAAATPSIVPAKPVTIDEVSRHPSELPTTTDYTLYQDGKYQNVVQRTGPITQEVHFTIAEGVGEMVKGTTMDFWTFDGKVPGPMIRARVGDTIDYFLHNPKESMMPHNTDFHAFTGPGGGSVRTDTAPGATSHLRAKLLIPGIFIYHCAFPDIPTHISHGMYGLVVVEPEGGLPKVDHEYYLMQSEFYTDRGGRKVYTQLKDAGHLANSLEFGDIEEPTFVVLNGRPEAVAGDRAIGVYNGDKIQAGETVRLFVGNIGPNLISSFHVIGEMFDKVYVEGSFGLINTGVQTTLIPSGGAVGVEFRADVPGDYLALDHAIFRVHKGMSGVIHVEGDPKPDIYDSISYSYKLRGG
jgi:nitrite reductase (NO-forming)